LAKRSDAKFQRNAFKNGRKDGRIIQIKETEMFAFLPPKEERKQMAVIVIPGGGYYKLTYDLEVIRLQNGLILKEFQHLF
jgi:hypothetical protein